MLVVVIGEIGSMEIVVTLLGDGVDTTAREAALTHIEGGNHHLDFLNSVHRDGVGTCLTAIGSARCQTEYIVLHRTVDLEAVVAVVAAGKRDTAYLRTVGHRHVLHHIIHIALNRGSLGNLHLAEVARCACLLLTALACDNHLAQCTGVGHHVHLQLIGITQLEIHIVVNAGLIAHIRHLNTIGTAGAHTLNGEAAVHVRHGVVLGARRSVNCTHGGSHHLFIVFIYNHTSHRRCGYLRIHSQRHHQRCNQHAKFESFCHRNCIFKLDYFLMQR